MYSNLTLIQGGCWYCPYRCNSNLHIQSIDQTEAIKRIKRKLSDIEKMKIEEQMKANKNGYDMDILPPDLVTYSTEAKTLLEDLQSRNERMFMVTVIVLGRVDNSNQAIDLK